MYVEIVKKMSSPVDSHLVTHYIIMEIAHFAKEIVTNKWKGNKMGINKWKIDKNGNQQVKLGKGRCHGFQFLIWWIENRKTKPALGPLEGQDLDVVERILSHFLSIIL